MINKATFYKNIKANGLFPTIKQSQVEGIEATLNEWDKWVSNNWVDDDKRKLAYILATDYHEGAKTMQPIKEFGGNTYFIKRYWTNVSIRNQLGNKSPEDAVKYAGKGKPQLTGRFNYNKMGKLLGYDLINNPNLMLDLKISTEVMFEGMLTGKSIGGDFTGKHLGNYLNKTNEDWLGARKVVNGNDKSALIKECALKFLSALS